MVGGNTRAGGGARKAGGPRGRPRHCNGQYSSTRTPLAAGAAGKVSRMARSQETTFVRATFAEPRGRCWWRSGAFWRVLVTDIPLGGVSVLFFCIRRASLHLLIGLFLAGCAKADEQRVAARDDFGNPVGIGAAPRRIVSLNPATTEILFALGAGSRVIGRTEYDLWPDSARLVPAMGGGINVNVESVLGAHPDLVLLYASQDNRSAADRLRAGGINTVALKVDHIADFRRTTELLGLLLHDSPRARTVIDSVQHTLDSVRLTTRNAPQPRVFWHIWDSPLITVGSGSFMS